MTSKGLQRSSKFNPDVLRETDGNGDPISVWCIAGSKPTEAICTICNQTIRCNQHGVSAVKRHATSTKHVVECKKNRREDGTLKRSSQLRLNVADSTLGGPVVKSHSDKVVAAETLFTFAVASSNIPYSFGDTATQIFPCMFGDSQIAKDLKCGRKKLSYIVSDGVGPHLKRELIEEIHNSGCFYSLVVDETPITEKRVQQFDLLVRFFSESDKEVITHHLQSAHIGHGTAQNLLQHVQDALTELPSKRLLNIFSDGPNVMKSLKKEVKKINPLIVDIGSCNLHTVHNSFSKGLESFGGDIESLVIDLYYFFKRSAVQSEDLKDMQLKLGLPEHVLVRHVQNRWLTLQSSVGRLIEQFSALRQFFKEHRSSRSESIRLGRISELFANDKTLLAKALFLKNVADLFVGFLNLFQKEEPLVHILYDELVQLLKKLMGRFLQVQCFSKVMNADMRNIDVENGENWLQKPEIGLDTEKEISSLPFSERKLFRLGARSFYIACTKYLLKSLPLDLKFLENLKCLHPLFRTEPSSLQCIKQLGASVPSVISGSQVSNLADEWIQLQSETLNFDSRQKDSSMNDSDSDTNDEDDCHEEIINSLERVDHYWQRIFELKDQCGRFKYKLIAVLVKALLCLPHGNSDCERGFSVNKQMLQNRSNMSIQSINGLRHMKSHVKRLGGVKKVVITRNLMKAVRNARQNYAQRLQREASSAKTKTVVSDEKNYLSRLKDEAKILENQLCAAQNMLTRAEKSIDEGLKKKDMTAIESGQVLLKEAKERISTVLKKQEENRKHQLRLHQTKKL